MFKIKSADCVCTPPTDYLPAAVDTWVPGMVASYVSGNLTEATGVTKPTYLCVEAKTVSSAGELVGFVRIHDYIVLESVTSVNGTLTVGEKYTIAADGKVTATTTNGTFEIESVNGATAGSVVTGRFA